MRKKTIGFILLMIVAVAVFDTIAISKGGTEASISQIILEWSYKYPLFTFMVGIVCGHLFWRIRDTKESKRLSDASRS